MSEKQNYTPIAATSEEVVAAIRRKTALSLPDDPSAAGISAATIRRRLWEAICGADASVLSELTRIIHEANISLNSIDQRTLDAIEQARQAALSAESKAASVVEDAKKAAIAAAEEAILDEIEDTKKAATLAVSEANTAATAAQAAASTAEQAVAEAVADAEEKLEQAVADAVVVAQAAEQNAKQAAEEAKRAAESAGGANIFANALKGSATGSAVRMDGVSPIEHEMKVKVSGVEDVSTVKVQRYGKNLVNADTVLTGLGWVKQEDGSYYGVNKKPTIIFENTAQTEGVFTVQYEAKCNESDVTATPLTFRVFYTDGTNAYVGSFPAANCTGEYFYRSQSTNSSKIVNYIQLSYGEYGYAVYIRNLQIEQGKTATDYEPYTEPTEYSVNADGTVDGVMAIQPTTTLMTDTEGAVIDVEYNQDLNAVLAEIYKKIADLM